MSTTNVGRLAALLTDHGYDLQSALDIALYVDAGKDNLTRVARLVPLLSGSEVDRAQTASKLLRDAHYMSAR